MSPRDGEKIHRLELDSVPYDPPHVMGQALPGRRYDIRSARAGGRA